MRLSKVNLVWATPNGENLVAYMARVSNPGNQNNPETAPKLLKYLIKNKHWSPFEMVHMCMEIETTRDIARQILRHRSFSFQEFSQRYSDDFEFCSREYRLQDHSNRQNSVDALTKEEQEHLQGYSDRVIESVDAAYESLIKTWGVAKECARVILPEGLTMSTLYVNGTLRSWLHYLEVRDDIGVTQKEHVMLAREIRKALLPAFPTVLGMEGVL